MTGRLLRQAAAVAELAGQEARYAAMLAALQETVGQAVAETAASRAQLAAGEAVPASAAAATAALQAHHANLKRSTGPDNLLHTT